MPNPSAVVLINGTVLPTTGETGLNVAAGSTVTIALASVGGVNSWHISCTNYDGYNYNGLPATINAGLVVNQNNYTATFTAPAMQGIAGSGLQFTSIVNAGWPNQNIFSFGVWVLNSNDTRFLFGSESFESNATVGAAYDFNLLILRVLTSSSPEGPAGGDLGGNYPNPEVVGLLNHTLPSLATGYLNWTGSHWALTSGGSLFTAGGDLSGSNTSQEVVGILSNALPSLTTGYLNWTGSAWAFTTGGSLFTAGGDLSGSNTSQTVVSISGSSPLIIQPATFQWATPDSPLLTQATPVSGNGNNFTIQAQAGHNSGNTGGGNVVLTPGAGHGSGSSGVVQITTLGAGVVHSDSSGDLTSSLIVNADVSGSAAIAYSKLNLTGDIVNSDINSSAAIAVSKLASGTNAQILLNNSVPTPTWTTVSGDVSITNAGITTVSAIRGNTVSGTSATAGQFLIENSSANGSAWTSITGDATASTGTPGDLTVVALQGNAVSNTSPTTNYVLAWNGSDWTPTSLSSLPSTITWADDLAGSTNTAQYVAAISGNAGAGGTIPFNANLLQWNWPGASPGNWGLTVTTPSAAGSGSGSSGSSFFVNGSYGQDAASSGGNGGNAGFVNLAANSGGAAYGGGNTGGAGGSIVLNAGVAGAGNSGAAAGTEGYIRFEANTIYLGRGFSGGTTTLIPYHLTGTIAGGALVVSGGPGNGTNQNGGNLVLSSGAATGSGTAGTIQLQLSGSNSSTKNATYLSTDGSGNILFNSAAVAVAGATAGGDLSGTYLNPTVAKIQGNTVTSGSLTKGQFFVATSTSNWAATSLSGDVSESGSTAGLLTVIGLQGNSVSNSSPSSGEVLTWNGSAWAPAASGGVSVTGSGFLHNTSGSLDAAASVGTAGQFALTNSAATDIAWTSLSGDVSASVSTVGKVTVTGINTATVPAAGSLTTGNVLQVSGSSALTYAAVNLGGGSNYVTGTLPAGNQAAQTVGGDLNGTTAAAYVSSISGTSGSGTTCTINTEFLTFAVGVAGPIIEQTNPAGVSSGAGTNAASMEIITQSGGGTSASAQTGGTGGQLVLQGGQGGAATGTGNTTGGASGGVYVQDRNGGAANTSSTGVGGAAAGITIQAGTGGHGGSSGTGGAGGSVVIEAGTGGLGGTAGTNGTVQLNVGATTYLTVSSTAVTVESLSGSGSGFVAVNNSGVLSFSSGGGSVTWADDLANSTNTNQYVSSLSYSSSAAGGNIAINGTGTALLWASGNTGPLISQASLSSTSSASGSAGVATTFAAQAGQAATGASHNGGAGGPLVLTSGAGGTSGSATAGSPGDVYIQMGAVTLLDFSGSTLGNITFSNSAATPNILQTALSSTSAGNGSAGNNFSITAQAGQAATGASHNGGNGADIILKAGTGGTSGSATAGSNGKIGLGGGQSVTVSSLKVANYTVTRGDYIIGIGTLTGSITITLPSSPAMGDIYIIKDVNGTCYQFTLDNSGSFTTKGYAVTISPASGNIDGLTSIIMQTPYQSVTLVYTGSQWSCI